MDLRLCDRKQNLTVLVEARELLKPIKSEIYYKLPGGISQGDRLKTTQFLQKTRRTS